MQFFTDYIYTIPSFTIPSVDIAIEKKNQSFTSLREVQNTSIEGDLVISTKIKDLFVFESESHFYISPTDAAICVLNNVCLRNFITLLHVFQQKNNKNKNIRADEQSLK